MNTFQIILVNNFSFYVEHNQYKFNDKIIFLISSNIKCSHRILLNHVRTFLMRENPTMKTFITKLYKNYD